MAHHRAGLLSSAKGASQERELRRRHLAGELLQQAAGHLASGNIGRRLQLERLHFGGSERPAVDRDIVDIADEEATGV